MLTPMYSKPIMFIIRDIALKSEHTNTIQYNVTKGWNE